MKGENLVQEREAPVAVPAPPRSDEVQDEPMNSQEASRKRSAEDAGHEADDAGRGGAQNDPGSMVDDSIPEHRREAEALGVDAVALAEAYSPASRQRAGAFGLSAGVAVDLRLGWDLWAHFESHEPVSLSLRCNTLRKTSWKNCGSRANVICGLHAV